jgi:Bacterial PH domain
MRLITRDSVGRPFNKYLLPQEDEVLAIRMHPAILLAPATLVVAGLIVSVLLSTILAGSGYVIDIIWLAWGLLMLGLILRIASWFTTAYAVTSYRVLRAKGLLIRKVWMMPLKKITDVTFQRSARGRRLDYGRLVVEFGYEQRLWKEWNIEFAPHPEQIYAEMRRVLFPEKDKGDD